MMLKLIEKEDIEDLLPAKYIRIIEKDKIIYKDGEGANILSIKNNDNITITISDYSGEMDYVLYEDFNELKR